jgi:hypothetical protein
MTKVTQVRLKIYGEEYDKLVVKEREDEAFLNRNAFPDNLSRIQAASNYASRRADKIEALASAIYGRDRKGLDTHDEISDLTYSMSDEDIDIATDLAAWWTN